MKWWGWILIGLLLGAGAMAAVAGSLLHARALQNAVRFAADSVQAAADARERAVWAGQRDSLTRWDAARAQALQAALATAAQRARELAAQSVATIAIQQQLASAQSQTDSFPILVTLTGNQSQVIQNQAASITDLTTASTLAVQRITTLDRALALADSTTMSWHRTSDRWQHDADSLRHQTTLAPGKWFGFLPPLAVKPCASAILTSRGEVRMGVGICVVVR